MKKKSFFWSMLTVIMVAIMSISFSACGDDDDAPGDGTGVVGVWEGKSGPDNVVATFKSNGTGTLDWTIHDDATYYESETFTYVKDSETSGTMVVNEHDYDSNGRSSGSSTYIMKYSISGNVMNLMEGNYTIATLNRK